jgi:hypothetical protein
MSAADKTKLNGIATGATNVTIDNTLTQSGQAADAKATGDAVGELKSAVNVIVPCVLETEITSAYVTTANNYYRILETAPSTEKSYVVKISCTTTGNHTFQIGIAGSASSMKYTFGTFYMTANTPIYVYAYTPGGEIGKRPDNATVCYGNLIRRTYKNVLS